MFLAEKYEIRDRDSEMAGNQFLYLISVALESLTELTRLCESGEGWDHVPILVKGFFFCDLFPS